MQPRPQASWAPIIPRRQDCGYQRKRFIDDKQGPDPLYGKSERYAVYGGKGGELIRGGNDDKQTSVGPRAKDSYGGPGDDAIHGGAGNDTVVEGTGDDLLTGGAGDDVIFAKDDGRGDRIDCGDGKKRNPRDGQF